MGQEYLVVSPGRSPGCTTQYSRPKDWRNPWAKPRHSSNLQGQITLRRQQGYALFQAQGYHWPTTLRLVQGEALYQAQILGPKIGVTLGLAPGNAWPKARGRSPLSMPGVMPGLAPGLCLVLDLGPGLRPEIGPRTGASPLSPLCLTPGRRPGPEGPGRRPLSLAWRIFVAAGPKGQATKILQGYALTTGPQSPGPIIVAQLSLRRQQGWGPGL